MGTRNWRFYMQPNLTGIKLGKFASSAYSSRLAKSCCANYAQTRRNVLAITTNVSSVITPMPYAAGFWSRWLRCPIGTRIVRPGTLTVWILAKYTNEGVGNNVHCQVKVGNDYTQGTVTLGLNPTWSSFEVPLTHGIHGTAGDLEISFRTVGTNTMTIYSVSAYQLGDAGAPEFVDLSGGMIGSNYGPDDVLAMKLLRDNVVSVRGWKVPRANVFNHWYWESARTDTNYSVVTGLVNQGLGSSKFVKRKGISEVKLLFMAGRDGAATSKVRAEITGLSGAPAEGAAQEIAITTASGVAPGWYTVVWTLHADDVDEEVECGLYLDCKDSGTNTVYLAGYSLIETDPDSSHAHTVPDANEVDPADVIEADHHEEIMDTCHHLYYYGGRQILLSDWRHHYNEGSGIYSSTMICTQMAFDNRSWFAWGVVPSVIARALLFSSTSSKRLRVRMGYHTEEDSRSVGGYTKTIHTCTTKTIDGASGPCGHIDANPAYDGDDDNDHIFTEAVDGQDGNPVSRVEQCFLDIDSDDWENQSTGAVAQICLQAITSNAYEYIVPEWITVDEADLEPVEFP